MALYLMLPVVWFGLWIAIIGIRYFSEINALWKEPVLKSPVLIFESDDWGAGPTEQIDSLNQIIRVLRKYKDKENHPPVMTLGVILSIPDAEKLNKTVSDTAYTAKTINHPEFLSITEMMLTGANQGVFDLQLHGMAHYWPRNLMREFSKGKLSQEIVEDKFYRTEKLPSVIQSRWVNTETLPTTPLDPEEIRKAVEEEVSFFNEIFGFTPKVVVPPTFVWTQRVEQCWKQEGVEFIITPGQCFTGRDKEGRPVSNGKKIVNGQKSESGLKYIVRNNFFEPILGHTAETAIKAFDKNNYLAQPTLLEIHRINFIQDDELTQKSLNELEKVVRTALNKYPDLLFLSTQQLAENYWFNHPKLIEKNLLIRLLLVSHRLWNHVAIRKWLYISGLFIPLLCLTHLRKKT